MHYKHYSVTGLGKRGVVACVDIKIDTSIIEKWVYFGTTGVVDYSTAFKFLTIL